MILALRRSPPAWPVLPYQSERASLQRERGWYPVSFSMAVSRVSLVFAVVVALVFAIILPPALANAQTQTQASAPAPSPTSDGKFFSHHVYNMLIVNLNMSNVLPCRSDVSGCESCDLWGCFDNGIIIMALNFDCFAFRDVDWPRDCICADGGGAGAHLSHSRCWFLLQLVNYQCHR